jgi:hypothetical protein
MGTRDDALSTVINHPNGRQADALQKCKTETWICICLFISIRFDSRQCPHAEFEKGKCQASRCLNFRLVDVTHVPRIPSHLSGREWNRKRRAAIADVMRLGLASAGSDYWGSDRQYDFACRLWSASVEKVRKVIIDGTVLGHECGSTASNTNPSMGGHHRLNADCSWVETSIAHWKMNEGG